MLALTRKRGEAITIGTDIRIVVLQVKGGSVRLGVEAPRSIEVHRDEVYSRILEQNRLAAAMPVPVLPVAPLSGPKRPRTIHLQVAGGMPLRMVSKPSTHDDHDPH